MNSILTIAGLRSALGGFTGDVDTGRFTDISINTLRNVDVSKFVIPPNSEYKLVNIGLGIEGYLSQRDNASLGINPNNKTHMIDLKHGIPLVLRKKGDDLDKGQRLLYRLRAIENINGIEYIAYYNLSYKQEINTSPISIDIVSTENGNTSVSVYNALDAQKSDAVKAGSTHVRMQKKITLSLGTFQVNEIINALDILYPSEHIRTISEVGAYSGYDITHDDNSETLETTLSARYVTKLKLVKNSPSNLVFNISVLAPYHYG